MIEHTQLISIPSSKRNVRTTRICGRCSASPLPQCRYDAELPLQRSAAASFQSGKRGNGGATEQILPAQLQIFMNLHTAQWLLICYRLRPKRRNHLPIGLLFETQPVQVHFTYLFKGPGRSPDCETVVEWHDPIAIPSSVLLHDHRSRRCHRPV
jgi:hypothetical protein